MKRRTLIAAALSLSLAPLSAIADNFVNYTPGTITSALSDGKTVLVDYSASWCSTCKRQARVINALRSANPAYDEAMMFVKVDWDTYRSHEVSKSRNIPRRSTLLVLRGDKELARVIAGTSESQIKSLMDSGL